MSVRIAILGASGAVGSALAAHILRAGLLEPQDCLMLGRRFQVCPLSVSDMGPLEGSGRRPFARLPKAEQEPCGDPEVK